MKTVYVVQLVNGEIVAAYTTRDAAVQHFKLYQLTVGAAALVEVREVPVVDSVEEWLAIRSVRAEGVTTPDAER